MAALLIALLFSIAEAANGPISAKVMVNNGELRLIPIQGKEMIYGNGVTDLLLVPQTVLESLAGTCTIEIGETKFILDEKDSLAYESSENDLIFRCMGGSIEAMSGEKTHKLGRGEAVALNSLSGGEESQNTVSRARSLEVQRFSLILGSLSPTSPSPIIQGVAFTKNSPWKDWYGATPSSQWVTASPYW